MTCLEPHPRAKDSLQGIRAEHVFAVCERDAFGGAYSIEYCCSGTCVAFQHAGCFRKTGRKRRRPPHHAARWPYSLLVVNPHAKCLLIFEPAQCTATTTPTRIVTLRQRSAVDTFILRYPLWDWGKGEYKNRFQRLPPK